MNPRSMKRIVMATDFSDVSADALETAVAFARDCGARLDIVHVAAEIAYPVPPPVDMLRTPIDLPSVLSEASSRLQLEVDRVRALDVACESHVLVGRADAEIVDHAEKTGADLIVLGTHGRSGLGHALLGSVAEKVVRHAHGPVLTVPHRRAAGDSGATSPSH